VAAAGRRHLQATTTSSASGSTTGAAVTRIAFKINADTTAVLDMPNTAYAAANTETAQVPVKISYKQVGAKTTIQMRFSNFKTLYYDPVASIGAEATVASSSGGGSNSDSTSKNAAGATVAGALRALLGAAVSAVLLAWL
jgi:hypothetical protein